MPHPDEYQRRKAAYFALSRYLGWLRPPNRKRPRRKGGDAEREPVTPDKPKPLEGGAAAALEFDE